MLAESFETFNKNCQKIIFEHRTFGSVLPTGNSFSSSSGPSPTPQSVANIAKNNLTIGVGTGSNTVMKRGDVDSFSNIIR